MDAGTPACDDRALTMTEPNAPSTGPADPEELEAAGTAVPSAISPATTMGPVHLTVADLDRSLAYYRDAIGLTALERGAGRATLGVGDRELLRLVEHPAARPAPGHTGLYHFALLVPERRDLATWLAHAARDRVPLVGLSDHFVSEALYLSDPDAHGIEIYWDRPRATWEGQVAARMTTLPLDVDDLIGELADPNATPFDGLPTGTTMGHVHLKVADVGTTVAFYQEALGFGLMAALGAQAAFLGAGGYHHHIGANTWESPGASPPPADAAALRQVTITLPDDAERTRVLQRLDAHGHLPTVEGADVVVVDPSGTRLALTVAA